MVVVSDGGDEICVALWRRWRLSAAIIGKDLVSCEEDED